MGVSGPLWLRCVLLRAAVLVVASQVNVPEGQCSNGGSSLVPSLLQAAGFSPSCVTAAIASCSLDVNQETSFIKEVRETVSQLKESVQESQMIWNRPRHCRDLLDSGDTGSGIRQVYPFLKHRDASVTVYCEQTVDGGGWTVFQRRRNLTQREDFYRTWIEYRLGFGHLEGEFWLGLDILHELASTALQELRVDLKDYDGEHRWAKYGKFYVGPLASFYSISVGRYTGTAGDGLGDGTHDSHSFSTHDADHDTDTSSNCAERFRGAWWYYKCHISNLNGYQHVGQHDSFADGINWKHWKGYHYSLQETTMMIRPAF